MSRGLVDSVVSERFNFPPRRRPPSPEGLVDKMQRERFGFSSRPVFRYSDDPPPLMSAEELYSSELALKLKIAAREQAEIDRNINSEFKAKVAAMKLERKLEKERIAAENRAMKLAKRAEGGEKFGSEYHARYYRQRRAANPEAFAAKTAKAYREKKSAE